MAPLSTALKSKLQRVEGETNVYVGTVDEEWCIGSVPQGGYGLGLILDSCIRYQAESPHPDPVHLSSQFLKSLGIGPYEVRIKKTRTGKSFTHLSANILQADEVRIQSHQIFGILPDASQLSLERLTIVPPSLHARRIPMLVHPADVKRGNFHDPVVRFGSRIYMSEDTKIKAKTRSNDVSRAAGQTVVGGAIEWASWAELTDDDLDISMMPFFVDSLKSGSHSLPRELKSAEPSWFPSVALSMIFVSKIPKGLAFSSRAVAVYARTVFVTQGRHDGYCEVWTAPSSIGVPRESNDDEWREKMVLLAVGHQMQLTVPAAVNNRKGKPKL